ncbi:rhodanese-like domain-containing protein [Tumebacillus sp. DT12]|uniref:Rhodanese-like domain-containing protein n=1 Tax=Tumebacillus lacus TaxID=2995335 RepID=A0ABT3X0C6_9BACL|nr:rhodanese-like domain-containing protein [Tumebacillus lacus]MCX7569005.1 rhodanese-like domain-containing protein [Tumebacillus lacus]
MPHEIDGIQQIDQEELQQLLKEKEGKIKFIDVREPEEYNAGHIPNVPLIPMNSIPQRLDELDKDEEYVFICRSGNRSHMVSRFLKQQGFEKVTNFNGGMLSWRGDVKQGMEE